MMRHVLHGIGICRPLSLSLSVVIAGVLVGGCSERIGVVVPPNQQFDPVDVANSVHSLRFAPGNIALLQVSLIAEALGFLDPVAAAVTRSGASSGEAEAAIPTLPLSEARAERQRRPTRGGGRLEATPRFATSAGQGLVASRIRASVAAGGATRPPLFPLNFLGRTFVYDPTTVSYFADDAFTNAPPDGVRFLLYDLDFSTGLPSTPLFTIGFVDLIDLSNATSTRLRVRAIDTTGGSDVTLADYVIDGALALTPATLAVSFLGQGSLNDIDGQFDFDLDELLEFDDVADETILSLNDEMVSDEGARIRVTVEGVTANDGSSSDLTFGMNILGPTGTTEVDLSVAGNAQNGEIRHNGDRVVQVTGTVQAPVFTRTDGGSLTPSDVDALDELLFAIDDVLILAGDVLLPLFGVFGVQ